MLKVELTPEKSEYKISAASDFDLTIYAHGGIIIRVYTGLLTCILRDVDGSETKHSLSSANGKPYEFFVDCSVNITFDSNGTDAEFDYEFIHNPSVSFK